MVQPVPGADLLESYYGFTPHQRAMVILQIYLSTLTFVILLIATLLNVYQIIYLQ